MPASNPTDTPAARRPWARHVLVWAVGLGLLALLLRNVPLQTLQSALAAPSPGTWALTLLGLACSYLMRAARLQVVLGLASQASAAHAPRWAGLRLDALRVILMHNAAVNLLPMRAGELSFPWLASRQLGMPLDRSVASLLWMRLQDLAVLLALGLLCWPGLPAPWRLAALALLAAGWWMGLRLLEALHRRWAGPQGPSSAPAQGGLRLKLRALLGKVHTALIEPQHHHWSAWGFTWANWSIKLAAGALLMSSIVGTPWGQAWAGALGGELAAVVPVQGPAGFGTYEAGVWAGFAVSLGTDIAPSLSAEWLASPSVGAPAAVGAPSVAAALQRAVPAALALHLCFLICASVAGALAWLLPDRHHTLPDPRESNGPQTARIPD